MEGIFSVSEWWAACHDKENLSNKNCNLILYWSTSEMALWLHSVLFFLSIPLFFSLHLLSNLQTYPLNSFYRFTNEREREEQKKLWPIRFIRRSRIAPSIFRKLKTSPIVQLSNRIRGSSSIETRNRGRKFRLQMCRLHNTPPNDIVNDGMQKPWERCQSNKFIRLEIKLF